MDATRWQELERQVKVTGRPGTRQEVTRVGRLGMVMGFGVALAIYVWIFFFSR